MRNCAVGTFDGHRVTVYAGKVRTAASDPVPGSAGSPTTGSGQTEGGLEVVRAGQADRTYPAGTPAWVEIVGVRGGTLVLEVLHGRSRTTRTFDLATGTFTPPA